MKPWALACALFLSFASAGQQKVSNSSVDWKAQALNAPTPDSLARLIGLSFSSEAEKVRAIYGWITAHIAYNTAAFKPFPTKYSYQPDPLDTAAVWPSGEEMTARKVMRTRTAVCDGYAKLFKVLCDYAGVEAAVIRGFGRSTGVGSRRFGSNHTWNAVRLDSAWHLLDVTWAAGHLDFADNFVRQQNDWYYLTPPERFIADHYPEDLRWTLLSSPPALPEFRRSPFRSKNYNRYGVADYFPSSGVVEAATGDTLSFQLKLHDAARTKQTSADPFVDITDYAAWPRSLFVKSSSQKGNTLHYTCTVPEDTEWIHLLYNDDVVLHYRLKPRETTVKQYTTGNE